VSRISEADVRHVARLARVGLDDGRIPELVAELNGILSHMDALQQVALPSNNVQDLGTNAMPLRDDDSGAVPLQRTREAFAPAMQDGFFLVPRLATHGAGDATTNAGDEADIA